MGLIKKLKLMNEKQFRESMIRMSVVFMMFVLAMGFTLVVCTSCTLTLNWIDGQGNIDEDLKSEAEVSPNVSVPAHLL